MISRRVSRSLAHGLAALVVMAGCSGGGGPDVAARVEGHPIMSSEVERLTRQLQEEQQGQGVLQMGEAPRQPLSEERVEQFVLSQLIKARAVDRAARRQDVSPPAGELARSAAEELASRGLGVAGLHREDYEAAVRSSLLSKALAEKLFPEIELTEAEMRAYFEEHPELFGATWQVTADLAFFKRGDAARRLVEDPAGSAVFAEAARHLGALEVITDQTLDQTSPLPPQLLEAIGKMGAPGTTGPVAVPNGFWVLYATKVVAVPAQTLEAARPLIAEHLADQRRQDKFAAWLTGELRRIDVEVDGRYGEWPTDFGV